VRWYDFPNPTQRRKKDIRQRRAGGADEQNGPAAMMVGKPSPNRRENDCMAENEAMMAPMTQPLAP